MILATLFLILLAYPLYRFGLQRTGDYDVARRYLPAFITFSLLLLLTAVFALNDLINVFAPRAYPRIESLAELDTYTDHTEDVVFVGTLELPPDRERINAAPGTQFALRLADGAITAVLSEGILAIAWPLTDGVREITADHAFVLVGQVQPPTPDLAETHIATHTAYAGDWDGYLAYLPRFAVIPALTMLLSLGVAIAVLVLPIRYVNGLRRRLAREATSQDATSQDATSQDATSQDATSQDATSQDATSQDA